MWFSRQKRSIAVTFGSIAGFNRRVRVVPSPWLKNKGFYVCKKKMVTSPETFCGFWPAPFRNYLEYVVNLEYATYISFFFLMGYLVWIRILDQSIPMVLTRYLTGHKRGRLTMDQEDDQQPNKKIRMGMPVTQYHCDVADQRLAQYIDKGNEDGLLISSVASCSNLWALIMDSGTVSPLKFTNSLPHFSTRYQIHSAVLQSQ
ncbi:hypothetical protein HanPI659440_Chr09g0330791 [Helianthus annuus]|nr:hypothetical protein HanPI659440_Chr09g0330791 [Helianthus annuus]